MSACRRPGLNERVFIGLGSKTSFLGLPIIILLITAQRGESVISAGGITVVCIYYFMSNIDNFCTAVEMLILNVLHQLIRIKCHLEVCKWIYCRKHFIILGVFVCVPPG